MSNINDNLGYVYIEEETSPDINKVNNFNVIDKNGVFYVDFESCLHSFGVMNRNSRMYEAANIEECLKTERIQNYLKHGGWFGEMNHPTPEYKDKPLSPERIQDIKMSNTSHKMLNPHIEGNLLVSRIQSDAGTDAGMNLAKKMVQGFVPAFSCRAIATLNMKNGKPTVNVRKIITYDWVLFQSHREAEQIQDKGTKFVNKSVTVVNENTNEDKVIPLTEILENVGKKDANVQMIMESFELDNSSLMGFNERKDHVIIKDHNNMIYCGMDEKSRKRVHDYLKSF